MFSLSQTTGYAVVALGCLARAGAGPVATKEVAACTDIPLPYLSKILHALARSGLVVSKRGYRGGFMLSRSPQHITVFEVATAVEGKKFIPQCLLGLGDCHAKTCPTRRFWRAERRKIEAELQTLTLADAAACLRSTRPSLKHGCKLNSERSIGSRAHQAGTAKKKVHRERVA